jgi:acetylglutamate kinase
MGPQTILNFIEILSNTESVNNYVLVVDGHSVCISEVVSALGLNVDNSNGKYDTAHLTVSIVFRAVLELIGKQRASTGSSQTAHGKDALLEEFLHVISNPDSVAKSVIVYNGQHISVQALVSAAGLHIDSATGKYDTHSLTADQLYETIQQFVSTTQNATT